MAFKLRRYQERALENFLKWKDTASDLATLILPTGTGKTKTCVSFIENNPNAKVLWVAHREELIDQAHDDIKSIVTWTTKIDKEIAKFKASPDSDIVVGSVQTLARKRKHLEGFEPDFIVIDEYHHRSEKNKTYQGLIERFPDAKVIGLTATPWRFNGDPLPLGETLFNMDIGTAINHGYLVPIVPEILKSTTSLANVKTRMGDFATSELSKAVNKKERNDLIAKRIIELVAEGRQGIVFGVDVKHAHDMYELLKEKIRAAEVYGDTPKEEREEIMRKVKAGEIDCLFNNLIATEGFDAPHLSFAVIARPTRSLSLYIQMVGRVLRTFKGKTNAIIIDVYDKIKVKQSRVTFQDMEYEGDLLGERKRANNILTADLGVWDVQKPGVKASPTDAVAKALNNFPVFMVKQESDRWTTDDDFLPVTSWTISEYQKLVTWTEDRYVKKLVVHTDWKPLKFKPTNSLIHQTDIKVRHDEYGDGIISDSDFGTKVFVDFDNGWGVLKKSVDISELTVENRVEDYDSNNSKVKINRVFYLCFPTNVEKGRLIEFTKVNNNLVVDKDTRMTMAEAKSHIEAMAKKANVWPLVRKNAKWKKSPISDGQKNLIANWVYSGKLKFDLDVDAMTKGDASAVIEQMKWQSIINQKFGASSKEELLGYDEKAEDV